RAEARVVQPSASRSFRVNTRAPPVVCSTRRRTMNGIRRLVTGAALAAAGTVVLSASDPTAVYARIDKVMLEPAAGAAERIQMWGVFALAKPNDRNDYLPPARGYLYFAAPGNATTARKEWADLQAVAGTGQIVSFGSRFEMHVRLRHENEPAAAPDVYALNVGVTRVRGNTDYPPVRDLLAFRH